MKTVKTKMRSAMYLLLVMAILLSMASSACADAGVEGGNYRTIR